MKKITQLFLLFFFTVNVFGQHYEPVMKNICKHVHQKEDPLDLKHRAKSEFYDDYDVKFHFIDIHLENNTVYVEGNVTTKAEILVDNLSEFKLELINNISVDSVFVDGESRTFTHTADIININIPPKNIGDMVSVQVYYHGTPPTGGFFTGISTATTWAGGQAFDVTWTLSEPYGAKSWWPCKQDLTDKADSSWCFITTNSTNKVGSNGLLTAVTPMPDNKSRYEWKTKYPIDYYLISASVANYQDYSFYTSIDQKPGDSLLVQNYIYNSQSYLNTNKDDIDATGDMIKNFSNHYGVYPFWNEKYGHCTSNIGGGMEHQTMTTLYGFGHTLVAHELSHQWFGDNVTCATWSDIWVNEGFARYSEYISLDNLVSHTSAQQFMANKHSNVMSSPGGSVYVPEDELSNVWRIFDGRLTYDKGGAVLHMLRFKLQNDSLFFQAYRNYQEQYKGDVATGMDFKNVVEQTTGLELDDFFNQWYFGEGYPTFSIHSWQEENEFMMRITETTSSSVTPLFKMLVEYQLNFSDGTSERVKLFQNENVQTFTVPVEKTVVGIEVDPDNWSLNKVGQISISTENLEKDANFSIAPNPAKDVLHIYIDNKLADGKHQIQLLDLTGRVVLERTIDGQQMNLDVYNLQKGTYIAVVKHKDKLLKQKVLVN